MTRRTSGTDLKPVTPTAELVTSFHDFLLVIITGISVFVLLLLLYNSNP